MARVTRSSSTTPRTARRSRQRSTPRSTTPAPRRPDRAVPRPRLLAVGEGCSPTGYARVMEGVLGRLSGAFDTTLFAVNHRGAAPSDRPYAVRSNALPGDVYGCEQLPALLAEFEPDVVLIHGNSGAYLMHRAALEPYR